MPGKNIYHKEIHSEVCIRTWQPINPCLQFDSSFSNKDLVQRLPKLTGFLELTSVSFGKVLKRTDAIQDEG